jgi:predicted GIY-YIG superfamily endonuclease
MQRMVIAGVYFFFKDRRLKYIGKSKDVDKRINQHQGNGREFDLAISAAVPISMLDMVEQALIKAFRPEQTCTGKLNRKQFFRSGLDGRLPAIPRRLRLFKRYW